MKLACACGNIYTSHYYRGKVEKTCPICGRTNVSQVKTVQLKSLRGILEEGCNVRPHHCHYEYETDDHSGGKVPCYWPDGINRN